MPRYFLAPHSYACEASGYGVFLDLKHDKYTAVLPEDLKTLRNAVHGWSASTEAATDAGEQATTPDHGNGERAQPESDVIEELLKEGLLTTDTAKGKLATMAPVAEPKSSLWEFPRPWPEFNRRSVKKFFWAWAATTLRLRVMPISHVINHLRRGKLYNRRCSTPFDIEKARLLTAVHFALQPAFYSAKDACLRNSLTLLEFLAKFEVYPTCVFGVKMEPFTAHAWVQHGPVLFTDPLEHVRTFTPIMCV